MSSIVYLDFMTDLPEEHLKQMAQGAVLTRGAHEAFQNLEKYKKERSVARDRVLFTAAIVITCALSYFATTAAICFGVVSSLLLVRLIIDCSKDSRLSKKLEEEVAIVNLFYQRIHDFIFVKLYDREKYLEHQYNNSISYRPAGDLTPIKYIQARLRMIEEAFNTMYGGILFNRTANIVEKILPGLQQMVDDKGKILIVNRLIRALNAIPKFEPMTLQTEGAQTEKSDEENITGSRDPLFRCEEKRRNDGRLC